MKTLPIKVSSKMIDELSLLYSDKFKALGEIVINSIDSGAKHIWVITQKDGEIKVIDDGIGMDEDDIINRYLLFGYSYKQGDKFMIGHKGIAKVSGLSIADRMTIKTWKDCKKHTFYLDRDDYRKVEFINDYTIPHQEGDLDGTELSESGTEVLLTKLRLSQDIQEKELIGYIALNLPVFSHEIRVNGILVQRARIPYNGYMEINEVHPTLGRIQGELFQAKEKLSPYNGVLTKVKGVVVGKPTIYTDGGLGVYSEYLGGEIEMVDGFEQNDVGLITAGREGFVETNPLFQMYAEFMKKKIAQFITDLNKVAEDKRNMRNKKSTNKKAKYVQTFVSELFQQRFKYSIHIKAEQIPKGDEARFDEATKTLYINTLYPTYQYATLSKTEPFHIARVAIDMVLLKEAKSLAEYRKLADKLLKQFVMPLIDKKQMKNVKNRMKLAQ